MDLKKQSHLVDMSARIRALLPVRGMVIFR